MLRARERPPPLVRSSALVPVKVANRSLARKLVLDPDEVYYYYFTTRAGEKTHHLLGRWVAHTFAPSLMPEVEYV